MNHRRIKAEMPVEALAGEGITDVAMRLVNPILRLFDGYEMTAAQVNSRLQLS
jgi:hypothetical protein